MFFFSQGAGREDAMDSVFVSPAAPPPLHDSSVEALIPRVMVLRMVLGWVFGR